MEPSNECAVTDDLLAFIVCSDLIAADTNPLVSFGQAVLNTVHTVVVLLGMILVSIVKAFLPCGLLPRKSVTSEVVLITGAGSGLGRLMAQRFAELGARLVLWDINQAGNEETAKMVENTGAEVGEI
jgi:hypothetical protein